MIALLGRDGQGEVLAVGSGLWALGSPYVFLTKVLPLGSIL